MSDLHEGKHPAERRCLRCHTACIPGRHCRCCLAAEVAALTARADAAEAAIERVQKLAQTWDDMAWRLTAQGVRVDLDPAHVAGEIKRALDGACDE